MGKNSGNGNGVCRYVRALLSLVRIISSGMLMNSLVKLYLKMYFLLIKTFFLLARNYDKSLYYNQTLDILRVNSFKTTGPPSSSNYVDVY